MQISVPHRTKPKNNSFDSTPANVKAWIDNLPMANVGETTRLLYNALQELNSLDIPTQQRFKTMELLGKPTDFVGKNMKKHFVGQQLPLDAKNLKIARLARAISSEMAIGYKILVMEQIAGLGRKDNKLLVTSIIRSIKLLSAVLLNAYQVYDAYPKYVWLELNNLYQYAEANKLHEIAITNESRAGSTQTTVTDAYKQIVLLALSCPYRLRHNEVENVYSALEQWSSYTDLQPIDENADALFSITLNTDRAPGYLVLRQANENRNNCRVLDANRLSERLRKILSDKSKSSSLGKYKLSVNALRRLMLAWGVMPKRRFSRTKDQSEVMVAMGLSSIHYFLSGEATFNNASVSEECTTDMSAHSPDLHFTEPASFKAHDLSGRQDQVPDVWEMDLQIEGLSAPTNTEESVSRAARGMKIDTTHRTHSWKMVNVSAGGYCLLWDNLKTTRSQVGELLGIREQSDPNTFHWRLAVTRWLKNVKGTGLELGVEMLSPGAVAIAAYSEKPHVKNKDFTRGLLLPEVASLRQPATLLLPSPPFQVGDTSIVNCHGKDVRVKLTKQVENTGSFAQFQFVSLGEVNIPAPKVSETKLKAQDFDDVWDII